MITASTVRSWLKDCSYKDWEFRVIEEEGGPILLKVCFEDDSGVRWSGRKWYISRWSTKSEVIQTALKAVLTAEEHEAREKFLYQGKAIFGPHIDTDALLRASSKTEVRECPAPETALT